MFVTWHTKKPTPLNALLANCEMKKGNISIFFAAKLGFWGYWRHRSNLFIIIIILTIDYNVRFAASAHVRSFELSTRTFGCVCTHVRTHVWCTVKRVLSPTRWLAPLVARDHKSPRDASFTQLYCRTTRERLFSFRQVTSATVTPLITPSHWLLLTN